MRIFVILKRSLQFTGLLEFNHPNGALIANILRIALVASTFYLTTTAAWFIMFESPTYAELARASASLFVYVYCIVQYTLLVARRRSFSRMLDALEAEISAREFTANGHIYKNIHERIEKIIWTCGVLTFVSLPSVIVPAMIQSYYSYYVMDLGKASFILSFPASYPYNWQTPGGYLATCIYLMLQFYDNNALHFNCCFLFFGICEFIMAFIADIRHSLKRFDAEIRDSVVFGTHRTSSELYYRLKQSFHGIIKFHMDIKQLADHCYTVYSSILFAFFTCGIYYWCVILLQFNMVIETQDPVMILTAVGCTGVFLPYMLFVCNLGANVTIAFGQLNVSIYMLSWHLCPSDLQQYMIAMVQVSAKPYNVPVFGSMDCSRDSFKQIINKGYSYFMMLRRMN